MKNIIFGNGVNVEFGGNEYKNNYIIERLINNLKNIEYSEKLNQNITSKEILIIINGLHKELIKYLEGKNTKDIKNKYEKEALITIKSKYSKMPSVSEVGMEDYFFIMKLFNNRYGETEEFSKDTFYGLSWFLLDSIYNNGKIQDIADNVPNKVKENLRKKLLTYENIFIVNYDSTVEKLAGKSIYYLHGNFLTLNDSYNEKSVVGKIKKQNGIINPVTDENKHIYCNAIFNFSGYNKKEIIEKNNGFRIARQNIVKMKEDVMSNLEIYLELKKFQFLKGYSKRSLETFMTLVNDSNLSHSYYPFNEFANMKGVLDVVGLSPYNDDHIWNAINDNKSINYVNYYTKGDYNEKYMRIKFPDIKIKHYDADYFWYS